MQPLLRAVVLAIAVVFLQAGAAAMAQGPVKQVKLTQKQVDALIAAQNDKDFVALIQKLLGKPASEPKIVAELDSAAAKHGFKDYAEYVDVFNTVGVVMDRIDPQTKALVDPQAEIKKEIAEISADKSIAEEDKKQMLKELEDALKSLQPIEHPGNLDLVVKHYDKLKDAL